MPESHASRGTRRGRRLLLALGEEIRASRIAAGLTLAEAAAAVGVSAAELSRIERGLAPWLDVLSASRICAVVGLDLSVRAFPGGDPLRDSAHARMYAAFRDLLGPGLRLRAEVPVTDGRDNRGWDGVLDDRTANAAVELESKIADGQALARRLALKQRDGEVTCLVLVVLDTRSNRAALRLARPLFESQFPLGDREIRQVLSAGRVPERAASCFCAFRVAFAVLVPRKQATQRPPHRFHPYARREEAAHQVLISRPRQQTSLTPAN